MPLLWHRYKGTKLPTKFSASLQLRFCADSFRGSTLQMILDPKFPYYTDNRRQNHFSNTKCANDLDLLQQDFPLGWENLCVSCSATYSILISLRSSPFLWTHWVCEPLRIVFDLKLRSASNERISLFLNRNCMASGLFRLSMERS